MSHPRISPLLNRLGGLYRDPSQVERDASSLLTSVVGKHLSPEIDDLVENDGTFTRTLCLKGTISIHFRGQEYQQLMDIYLPPGYPKRPPTCFVRLGAPNMFLKTNHPHVGSDGQVYLPYLHEWQQFSHSLIELVVAMSSVFSADPPVFTRTKPQPPPVPPPVPAPAPPPVPAPTYNSNSSGYVSPPPPAFNSAGQMSPMTRHQLEMQLSKEAEEANRIAQLAREAQQEEEQQRQAQEHWDTQNLKLSREKVQKKLYSYLIDYSKELQRDITADLNDQQKLENSTLADQIRTLKRQNGQLKEHTSVLDEKTPQIQDWLVQARASAATAQEVPVDEMVVTEEPVHEQMLQLSAENASVTDALYFLDKALHSRVIDMPTHLKEVRRLAKRQFLVRAHLAKITKTLKMEQSF